MNKNDLKFENITLAGQPSKRRMLRVINNTNYSVKNTKNLGFIFGLIDINLGNAQNIKVFDIINEGISRYYNNSLEYDISFDDMINFLNRRSSQFFSIKDLRENCNVVVGVLKGSEILFCANGEIFSYLIYSQGITKILPEEHNTLDVSDKFFSHSLQGKITFGSTLYYCNSEFNSTLNPYHLEKLIKKYGPKKIIDDINDALLNKGSDSHYNALFVYNETSKEATERSSCSVEDMFAKEQEITNNLSPSILNIMKKSLRRGSVLSYLLKYSIVFLKKISHILKFLVFLIVNSFLILTNICGKRKERQIIVNSRFKGVWFKITDFYRSLTVISKTMLVSIIIILIFLIIAANYNIHLQNIKKLKLSYQEKFLSAENLYDEADADILFQEKNIAVKKLKDALGILEETPDKIHDKDYNILYKKIKDRLYEIQNISEVSSPVLVADFSLEENTQLLPFLYTENNILGMASVSQIINIDINNQNIKRDNVSLSGLGNSLHQYNTDKNVIYSLESSSILRITDPSILSSEIKEVLLHSSENISRFAVYNEKMYIVSEMPKYFTIWKHSPSLSGFGKPILWTTENLPENSKILSFAVDGNMYVLFSNNNIFKFYRGNRVQWGYDTPVLDAGVKYFKLLINEELKYIYLVGQKVISVLSKNGDSLAHFILPSLDNIKDIAVNEGSRTIYILNGKKVYAFSYQI